MLCTYNLEIDLESGIHLHTIVFHLHCAVLVTLIVAQGLVEQVVYLGKYTTDKCVIYRLRRTEMQHCRRRRDRIKGQGSQLQ